MRKKRGKFTTFLCSLVPGAAEMYMGFMKKGISLMTIFILSIIVPSVLRVSDVFVLFAIVVWFYCFFHARNLADCKEEEFERQQDGYIWSPLLEGKSIKISSPVLRKWGGIILILYGIARLWDSIVRGVYYLLPEQTWDIVRKFVDEVPQVLIAIVVIVVGVKMIAGKKEELNGEGN